MGDAYHERTDGSGEEEDSPPRGGLSAGTEPVDLPRPKSSICARIFLYQLISLSANSD